MLRSAPRHVLPGPLPLPVAGQPARPRASGLRRLGAIGIALAFLATLLTSYAVTAAPSTAASSVGLFSGSVKPKTKAVSSKRAVNLGVRFTTSKDGKISGLQFYRSSKQNKAYTASLWDSSGKLLARTTFKKKSKAGWQTASLAKAVSVKKGKTYTVSYRASDGRFAVTRKGFSKKYSKSGITVAKKGGVYRYSSKNARPTKTTTANYLLDVVFVPKASTPSNPPSTPPTNPPSDYRPPAGWPSEANTGVPSNQTLTRYSGSLSITTNNAVIRNQLITGTLNIRASNVQIINSRINGAIRLDSPKTNNYSFTITDSEIHYPGLTGTGLMRGNFRATRIEITGGNRSVYCEYNCVIEDSLVHKQGADVGGDAHFSGIRMEQNGTFRHNTLICEAARGPGTGCSAALTGYGDFAPVQNNLIQNNLFIGGRGGGATMCAYGGSSGEAGGKPYGHLARDIRFINNVFAKGPSGKCGNLGAVAHFNPSRPGNAWTGNTWDDGTPIRHTD